MRTNHYQPQWGERGPKIDNLRSRSERLATMARPSRPQAEPGWRSAAPGRCLSNAAPYVMWKLLMRLYEIMPLQCPNCSGEMKIISYIKEADTIKKILTHLGEPTEAPQFSPARGPPDFDNVDEPVNEDLFDDIPEEEFDQRICW